MEKATNKMINDILQVIEQLKTKLRWKPHKAEIHLKKRIAREHLPCSSTLDEYESIILDIINELEAQLYIYQYNDLIYPTVVATWENRLWLVMFSMDGIIETAFPPDNPTSYLDQLSFKYIGLLKELTS